MKKTVAMIILAFTLCQLFSISAFAEVPTGIFSDAVLLMDADTGQILYEKNSNVNMYPASTTKIMTALLTVENSRPYEMITVSQGAVDIAEPDSSNIALSAGEKLTVADALYALMLPSANDAANVLAEYIGGSQEEFAKMMTQKAHDIGAVNTFFENAHGLHEPGHYTTAQDLALITQYAMRNKDFMQYFGAAEYKMQGTNLQPLERPFTNYQAMLVPTTYYYHPDVIGGKVGFTNEAGHTMSTVATKDGRTLVCVVMHSTNRYDKFKDTWALLDYGFEQFTPYTIPKEKFTALTLPAMQDGTEVGEISFRYNKDITVLLQNDVNSEAVKIRYDHAQKIELSVNRSCSIVLELEEPIAGVPTVLSAIPMESSLNITVFPVADDVGNGVLSSQGNNGATKWLVALVAVPVSAGALLIVMLAIRNRNLRKRRLARQARLAKRTRTAASTAQNRAYTPPTMRGSSAGVRRNVYQARRYGQSTSKR